VFKSESNVAFDLGNFRTTLGLGADDVFLAALPLHTLHGAKSMTVAMSLGACMTILPRFHAGSLLENARRDRATVLFASPAMIDSLGTCLLRDGDADALRSLRFCGAGGARLTADAHRSFAERYGVPVRNQYGSTESFSVSVDVEDGFVEGRVGRSHRGIEVRILDDHGEPVAAGSVGRISVKSPGASTGYVDDPETSANVFRNGWVLPGDRGSLDAQGRIHLLGRDDVINIGSLKVDPLEVARVIRDALPVHEVIVMEGERGGLAAVRALIEADPARVTRAMVVEACRARLSAHKVPAIVNILARFPRDASGKVLRSSIDEFPPPEAA
jgi:long-chain acyl-CoA synthetase